MTTFNSRLALAEADFNQPSQVPLFKIEREAFVRFFVETETDLPIIPPFTKEAKNYFTWGMTKDLYGIEQDPESGNYIVTASSSMSDADVYRALSDIAYD